MSISPYNPYDRYRRRSIQKLAGVFVIFAVMGVSAVIGFWVGQQHTVLENDRFRDQIETLKTDKEHLEDTITELRAEVSTAMLRYEQLQGKYQQTVPEGPAEELVALVNKRLQEGMDPKRLAFILHSARPPRNCTDPETKVFLVSTPAYKGPESSLSLADAMITVKARGQSAKNDKGEDEAWYDPSKPVALEFIFKDGQKEEKKGIMPLHQMMVIGDREYRFTITEGARSFAKVSFDSCDYP